MKLPQTGDPLANEMTESGDDLDPDWVIEATDLVKDFQIYEPTKGILRAVNRVKFRVGVGETLALVGESGSGKTTVGANDLGPDRANKRGDPLPRSGDLRAPCFKKEAVFTAHPSCIPGSLRCAESSTAHWQQHCRTPEKTRGCRANSLARRPSCEGN